MALSRLYASGPSNQDMVSAFNELQIQPTTVDEKIQLTRALTSYLSYPSDHLAQIHYESSRLGEFDEVNRRNFLKKQFASSGLIYQTCKCCCNLKQTQLNCCVPVSDIVTLGTAHRHFFEDIILMWMLMAVSLVVYAIYAFVSNIVVSNQNPVSCANRKMCSLALIGLGPKLYQNQTAHTEYLFVIQAYLGLAMVSVWIAIFIWKVFRQKQVEWEQDIVSPTAANFTVMVENMPQQVTPDMFQATLNQYAMRVRPQMIHPLSTMYPLDRYDVGFTITSFNSARAYYQTLHLAHQAGPSQIQTELQLRMECLRNMIVWRSYYGQFQEPPSVRQGLYADIDHLRLAIIDERKRNLAFIQYKFREYNLGRPTKIVFVTFNHTFAKVNLMRLNQSSYFGWLNCCKNESQRLGIPGITISPAPQPEDIIWENVGAPSRQVFVRRIITYIISFILLGISFGIILGLSYAQKAGNNPTISLLISFVINIINVILSLVIQYLTPYQKDWTVTMYQSSVAFKIIFCQLINSILLSIIVARYVKENIYMQGGLVDDVFFVGLLNAFIPPLVRFINPYYIYIKCLLRNYMIPSQKLKIEAQVEYNLLWENPEFELGLEYSYFIKTIIYTAFFMSLQPIIVFFALIGLILMYYSEKFALFYRSNRPRSSSRFITFSMKNILYFCIISYGLGSLTWSNFLDNSYPHRAFIPSVIAIGLGVLLYLVVNMGLLDSCFRNYYAPQNYQDEFLFFPSEYDRLNPATRGKGVGRFLYEVKRKRQRTPIMSNILQTEKLHDVDAFLQISRYVQDPNTNLDNNDNNILASVMNLQRNGTLARPPRLGPLIPTRIDMTSSAMLQSVNPVAPAYVDDNVLNNLIVNNGMPGQQKANMFSSKYNPLDYIQAANGASGFASQ